MTGPGMTVCRFPPEPGPDRQRIVRTIADAEEPPYRSEMRESAA